MDLNDLKSKGLSDRSREIIVTQSLAQRARPPLEIEFIEELADYGGDVLAQAYLEMDAVTADQKSSPLPPSSMKNMMAAGLSPSELVKFSQSVNPQASVSEPNGAALAKSGPMVRAMSVASNSEGPVEAPKAPVNPEFNQNLQPVAQPKKPQVAIQKPKDLRKIPQTLYPGQQADPARPLPEAPGPYWSRAPKGHDTFLGVTETVKADGHRYEVNTNAQGGRLGQEVLSRPSGHKVVRYYSMAPEKAQAAPAPNDFASESYEYYEPNYYGDSDYDY
ncbi:MAG: hypothetical protein LBE80_03730 [Deltaproteobacteria bacterium]|nr:hypothetical protein [Deltaproteobacteria bacterium]